MGERETNRLRAARALADRRTDGQLMEGRTSVGRTLDGRKDRGGGAVERTADGRADRRVDGCRVGWTDDGHKDGWWTQKREHAGK